MHYPNISYDRDSADALVPVGQAASWVWTVPAGEAWRLLFALVLNTDTASHRFLARISFAGNAYLVDELPALGAGFTGVLLVKTVNSLAGFDRRPGELWLPPGFAFEIVQANNQSTESTMNVTLAFARADSVRGTQVDEAVVVVT